MDELTAKLRQLGEAAQADVAPVTLDEIADRAADQTSVTDIGQSSNGASTQSRDRSGRSRRKPSRRMLGAAAALIVIVAGSIAFVGRENERAPVDLASARQSEPFTVPANDNGWSELRQCESSDTYDADTGNMFYGAYQITRLEFRRTAADLGLDEYLTASPEAAPPEIQDAVANAMYLERGDAPWPICGRHLDGPMITPMVPQWLGLSQSDPDSVFVFIDPKIEADRLTEIAAEISAIADANEPSPTPIDFVDKDEAFAQFQEMFADSDEALQPVKAADMPPRFEVMSKLSPEELQKVRDITGVFEVIAPESATPITGALRLSIPAIELETPVYSSGASGLLALGAVTMVESPTTLVVGGYGSTEGSVFARLGELRDGDTIFVSKLVPQAGASWEMVRTFKVDRAGDTGPAIIDLDDMLLWQRWFGPTLTLVADVAGEPRQRLMVRTQASDPDLAGYPPEPAN